MVSMRHFLFVGLICSVSPGPSLQAFGDSGMDLKGVIPQMWRLEFAMPTQLGLQSVRLPIFMRSKAPLVVELHDVTPTSEDRAPASTGEAEIYRPMARFVMGRLSDGAHRRLRIPGPKGILRLTISGL